MDRPLLIGVGNLHAGDDAAGRLVAQALHADGRFEVVEQTGHAADLVAALEGHSHVVIVDACHLSGQPGALHRFDVASAPLPRQLSETSSHGLGVAEGIELARALDVLPDRCTVYAIEGVRFGPGDPLSPEVRTAIANCAREIAAMTWNHPA